MQGSPSTVPNYPIIALLLRHQRSVPLLVGGLFILAGFWGALRLSAPDLIVAGLIVAGAFYIATRCALELVQVIAETLLPR